MQEEDEWQEQKPDDRKLSDQDAALPDTACSTPEQQLQQAVWRVLSAVQPSLCRALCFLQLPPEFQTYEGFEAAVLGWVAPEQQQQNWRKLLSSLRVSAAPSGACGVQRHALCRHCHQPGFANPKKVEQMQVTLCTVGNAQDATTATTAVQLGNEINAAEVVKMRSAASSSSSSSSCASEEGYAGAHDECDAISTDSDVGCCDVKVDYSSSSSSSSSQLLWRRPKPLAPSEACCAAAECVLSEVQQQVAGGLAALPAGGLTQQQWLMALQQGPLSELPMLGCSADSR
jgi:hypothetical protein